MENFGTRQEAETVLFDKNAPQKLTFIKEDDEARYELEFTVGNLSDEILAEFDRLSFIKVETDGDNQIFTSDDLDACDWFFNENVELTGGFEGDLPQNWRDHFGLLERQAIVRAFLEANVTGGERTKFKKAFSFNPTKSREIVLIANFDGQEVECPHVLPVDAGKYLRKFVKITQDLVSKKGETGTFLPETFVRLGRLYDSMGIRAAGYAENGVPLHHKALVLRDRFNAQAETHRKK